MRFRVGDIVRVSKHHPNYGDFCFPKNVNGKIVEINCLHFVIKWDSELGYKKWYNETPFKLYKREVV